MQRQIYRRLCSGGPGPGVPSLQPVYCRVSQVWSNSRQWFHSTPLLFAEDGGTAALKKSHSASLSDDTEVKKRQRDGGNVRRHPSHPSHLPRRGKPTVSEPCRRNGSHNPTATSSGEMGWFWAEASTMDAKTGETPLEKRYHQGVERARRWLRFGLSSEGSAAPDWLLSGYKDGSVYPHFLVGFSHYDYRLRDVYRSTIARKLNDAMQTVQGRSPAGDAASRAETRGLLLSPHHIQLSASWSGRFDVTTFHRVRKVCGVRVAWDSPSTGPSALRAAPPALPAELHSAVAALVDGINGGQDKDLLDMRFHQASAAVKEVELRGTATRSHSTRSGWAALVPELLWCSERWMTKEVLHRHAVVIVVGSTEVHDRAQDADAWITAERRANAAQVSEVLVRGEWLKLFSRRRLVPRVCSAMGLSVELAAYLLRDRQEGGGDAMLKAMEADASFHAGFVRRLGSMAQCLPTASPAPLRTTLKDSKLTAAALDPLSPEALDEQHCQCFREALCQEVSSNPTSGDHINAAASDWLALTYRLLQQLSHGSPPPPSHHHLLPIFFLHGAYGGRDPEIRLLRSHGTTTDVALLQPARIHYKGRHRVPGQRQRPGRARPALQREFSGMGHAN